MSAPLLDSVVLSDATLEMGQAGMEASSSKVSLIWVSGAMVFHTVLATSLAATVYIMHSVVGYPLSTGAFLTGHMLIGTVLGILLAVRVVLGINRLAAASKAVQDFAKVCRQLAVLSPAVAETLTVSVGAESEAKGVAKFRYELARLLNMAAYSFNMALDGKKMCAPPSKMAGSATEASMLQAADNATMMVCKMLASLVEQQRAAKRISSEQTAVLMAKVADLVEAYHAGLTVMYAPIPTAISSLSFVFTIIFCYTLGPLIAFNELGDNLEYASLGLTLTIFYTFVNSMFFFGLFEAGKKAELPFKEISTLIASDDMIVALSTDLADLTEAQGEALPVFLKK